MQKRTVLKEKKFFAFSTITFFFTLALTFAGCKKNEVSCDSTDTEIAAPYSSPVWHPNGNLIGFNFQPLSAVEKIGSGSCISYRNLVKSDSIGFYIMNKNGTGLRRVTNYQLGNPSWSPDGSKLAFAYKNNIYTIPFDGSSFDTTRKLMLTNVSVNDFPSWISTGQFIVYQTTDNNNPTLDYLMRMSPDGTNKVQLTYRGIQPSVGSDDKVYFIGQHQQVFSVVPNVPLGTSTQLTYYSTNPNVSTAPKRLPKYYNDTLFFLQNGLGYYNRTSGQQVSIATKSGGYDISKQGEIIYQSLEYQPNDRKYSTLWTMNTNGANKKQVTFNNY